MVRPTAGLDLLPPTLARHLERLALQVVSQRPQLELLLSGPSAPKSSKVDIWVVESEVNRADGVYEIETRLLDLKGKRLIKNVRRGNILEADLVRLFQAGIEALFTESEKTSNDTPTAKTPQPPELNSEKSSKPAPQLSNPSTIKAPSASAVDFRERVRGLKTDVDAKVSEVAEEEQEKKKLLSQSNSLKAIPGSKLNKKSHADLLPPPKSRFPYKLKYGFELGLEERTVSSKGYAVVRGTSNVIAVKTNGFFGVPWGKLDAGLTGELYFGRISSAPLDVEAPYRIAIAPAVDWKSGHFSVGFSQESMHFFGISSFGAGQSGGAIKANFLDFSAQQCISFWGHPVCFSVLYAGLRSAVSNFEVVSTAKQWSGSRQRISLKIPSTLKHWDFAMSLDQLQLESEPVVLEFVGVEPFSIQESRLAISLARSF